MMGRWSALLGLLLAGCSHASRYNSSPQIFQQDKTRYETEIGKNYWIRAAAKVCDRPVEVAIGVNCSILPAEKVKIDAIEEGMIEVGGSFSTDGIPYFHISDDSGRTGYIMAVGLMASASDVDPAAAAAECKRRGAPRVGMTYAQVKKTCWGEPDHANRTEGTTAVSDQLVYGDGRYVYLRNGVVTSIQSSGQIQAPDGH